MFVGREYELSALGNLLRKNIASFVVISGRRRIGKSRLIKEFVADLPAYNFSGLAPVGKMKPQEQLEDFSRQLARELRQPYVPFQDWGDAFWFLADKTATGRAVIVLDEISWLAAGDVSFLSKLKNAWDLHFKNNPELILIVCGSVSSWIEKNILASTGFVGRITLNLHLRPLSLPACNQFWGKQAGNIAAFEKFKVLSVTGGIPRYLEELIPQDTAEDNIKRMCFSAEGFLFLEFKQIFFDTFLRSSEVYLSIVKSLITGPLEAVQIAKKIKYAQNNTFSEYLNELVMAGFIARDYSWNLATGKAIKISRYRLRDNYLRFYLKYIEPNEHMIKKGAFIDKTLSSMAQWQSVMGLQFENLVLTNATEVWRQLNIPADEVMFDNPYYQRATSRHKGCQIDYLIQTKYNNIFVCEVKFRTGPIGVDVISEVQEKIANINVKRNFSIRPVLIHVNGVTDEVIDSGYFAKILDFGDLL